MYKTFITITLTAFLFAALISCNHNNENEREWKAQHVIFIGLDGLCSPGLEKADMPNVKRMMREGSYTLQNRVVRPSSSAVNWASMFMGATPELHGFTTWGSRSPEIPSRKLNQNGIFPTIFQLLRDEAPDAEIGVMYEWGGIKYLIDTVAVSRFAIAPDFRDNPTLLRDMAVEYIREKRPTLAAFIFDNPDATGHAHGWRSEEYFDKLTILDGFIGDIINALKEAGMYDNSIIIIASDHGGINKGHGGINLLEMEVPFIIYGKNVKPNGLFHESMIVPDVGATMAYIFNIEPPQVWIGRAMRQVFR